jgi:hypothetical protein
MPIRMLRLSECVGDFAMSFTVHTLDRGRIGRIDEKAPARAAPGQP